MGDLAVEGLSGELERLAHRQVRSPGLDDLVDGEPELDGVDRGENDVGCPFGDDGRRSGSASP